MLNLQLLCRGKEKKTIKLSSYKQTLWSSSAWKCDTVGLLIFSFSGNKCSWRALQSLSPAALRVSFAISNILRKQRILGFMCTSTNKRVFPVWYKTEKCLVMGALFLPVIKAHKQMPANCSKELWNPSGHHLFFFSQLASTTFFEILFCAPTRGVWWSVHIHILTCLWTPAPDCSSSNEKRSERPSWTLFDVRDVLSFKLTIHSVRYSVFISRLLLMSWK